MDGYHSRVFNPVKTLFTYSRCQLSPDLMEWQRPRGLRGAGPRRGHDLEPGGEVGHVRGQERGQGVAIVRPEVDQSE